MADQTVTASEFRALLSAFPSGVAVITAFDAAGTPHGLTCNALCSVTLTTPTLLACLDLRSGTLDALLATGTFAVNLLHAQGRAAAEVFSSPVPERFAQVPWEPSRRLDLPWLSSHAFAVAECVVSDSSVVGDHMVVFGEVVSISQEDDVPLIYGLRQFSAWPHPAVTQAATS